MKKLIVALSSLVAAAAMAQSLGTVTNVQGIVTATQGATGTTVAPGAAIANGTRFVTTSTGSVTLTLNSGCVLTLQPGQAVTVLQSMTCQQLTAAVQPVPTAPGTPVFAGMGPALVGLLVPVVLFVASPNDENLSPN